VFVSFRPSRERASDTSSEDAQGQGETPRLSWAWARLLRRVFDIDIEHCPNCGGAVKIIAASKIRRSSSRSLDTWACRPAPHRVPRRVESIYSRNLRSRKSCQRKATISDFANLAAQNPSFCGANS